MNPKNPAQSRTGEVWKRLIGCFGGDAVERKYGKTIPEEWEAMISRLKDFEIDRGLRRMMYSGRDIVPSLPAFVRLCRSIGNDEFDDGPKPVALPNPDDGKFDRWEIAGNRHLWNFFFSQMRARKFSEGETRIFVEFKNAWARDMREGNLDPETGEVSSPIPKDQREAWEDCMQRAEAEIARSSAKVAA